VVVVVVVVVVVDERYRAFRAGLPEIDDDYVDDYVWAGRL
jgi:hypothetical protein